LCDDEWWKTATTTDVKNELNNGIDLMACNVEGVTLHFNGWNV